MVLFLTSFPCFISRYRERLTRFIRLYNFYYSLKNVAPNTLIILRCLIYVCIYLYMYVCMCILYYHYNVYRTPISAA